MNYPDFRTQPTRPELEPLVKRFENIGISCELGLVQRHCRFERPSLFRFGYTPMEGLIDALDSRFEDIDDPDQLSLVEGHAREWITTHKRYGFEFHTNHKASEFAEADVRKKTAAHFGYLSQVFTENLEDADRIFVYRPEVPGPAEQEAKRLVAAMHQYGAATLLWIDVASSPDQAGTASWTTPGSIMTGYLDRYAKTRFAAGASFECWLDVLAAAAKLYS